MSTDEMLHNSVRTYFETKVFPEETFAREVAKNAAEEKKSLHNFARDSGRLSRRKERERQKKLETEPLVTQWDCGCNYVYNPLDDSLIESRCGTSDCLVERGMARIVE